MLPMKNVRLAIGTALAGAAPIDQAVDENIVRLIIAPFTPSEDLVVGDLTFADFDGSTALEQALGDAQVGIDPLTGQQRITITEPAGGWRWITTGVTNLPQTVYGAALLTAASAALIGVEELPEPIGLTEVGQEINLGTLKFDIVAQPIE